MKVSKILILIENGEGHVHQVLATAEHKEICLQLLRSDEGVLRLSPRIKPVLCERYDDNQQAN